MDSRQGLPALNHLLQHTLRSLCTDSQWVYAVFWRILPRNYPPPQCVLLLITLTIIFST
jgi:hypothetical protein